MSPFGLGTPQPHPLWKTGRIQPGMAARPPRSSPAPDIHAVAAGSDSLPALPFRTGLRTGTGPKTGTELRTGTEIRTGINTEIGLNTGIGLSTGTGLGMGFGIEFRLGLELSALQARGRGRPVPPLLHGDTWAQVRARHCACAVRAASLVAKQRVGAVSSVRCCACAELEAALIAKQRRAMPHLSAVAHARARQHRFVAKQHVARNYLTAFAHAQCRFSLLSNGGSIMAPPSSQFSKSRRVSVGRTGKNGTGRALPASCHWDPLTGRWG